MELSEEDWSKLSPEELMDRKDAIETEMQACNTVLENVRLTRCTARDLRATINSREEWE